MFSQIQHLLDILCTLLQTKNHVQLGKIYNKKTVNDREGIGIWEEFWSLHFNNKYSKKVVTRVY